MFYSDIKSAGAVLLATPPFEDNAKVSKVPSAMNAGAPAATLKNEMQMGELIDEHGGEF
jgi:hypothetical protein